MVIPEELAIYNEATAGYPFPMGGPVSVGSRTVPGGLDYLFTVRHSLAADFPVLVIHLPSCPVVG